MKSEQKNNPYYCPLIFNGMYVEKVNNEKVKVSACCVNTLGPERDTVDFDNDPHLVAQRELVKAGKSVPECKICTDNPTVFNLRHSAINFFEFNRIPVDYNQPVLNKLDWNVDPICNARCIQCSAHFSSAWAAEDAAHGKKTMIPVRLANDTRHNPISTSIDLTNLRGIYFNGGEPFLSKEPLEFLKRASDLGTISNLQFSVNTNGSIRPSEELLGYLQKCQSATINFSIDGTDSEFEYIRNPLSWNEVNDNLEWLVKWWSDREMINLRIGIGFTLGIHNVDLAVKTAHWSATFPKRNVPFKFAIQPCYGVLSLDYATKEMKQVWLEKFQIEGRVNDAVREIIENSANAANDNHWQAHLSMIDQRRKTDWRECLPELYKVLKKSQEL